MRILETIIELVIDIGRSLLVDAVSGRVRHVRVRRLRGMSDVQRHVHLKVRQRLFNRLSTERRG